MGKSSWGEVRMGGQEGKTAEALTLCEFESPATFFWHHVLLDLSASEVMLRARRVALCIRGPESKTEKNGYGAQMDWKEREMARGWGCGRERSLTSASSAPGAKANCSPVKMWK